MTKVLQSIDNVGYKEVLKDGQLRGMFQELKEAVIAIRYEKNGKSFKNFSSEEQAINWLSK